MASICNQAGEETLINVGWTYVSFWQYITESSAPSVKFQSLCLSGKITVAFTKWIRVTLWGQTPNPIKGHNYNVSVIVVNCGSWFYLGKISLSWKIDISLDPISFMTSATEKLKLKHNTCHTITGTEGTALASSSLCGQGLNIVSSMPLRAQVVAVSFIIGKMSNKLSHQSCNSYQEH